ncbi:uncharacterized protein KY384_007153 [Bacidia gigantensis]|uniref:uncharacterized protein n=1 Tax=Bacidia gigantensis TaxID=2732470 RepID=UPI001D0544B4|nr:uncharacterized protein KY384_007153 [Bacidia gigantensis]KAG8528236.1 hypothetical protein KY384_007153 [Bacidia gigantensis]
MAIDRLVDSFLESNPSQKKQIISLGAGTDTRYFRTFSRFDALEKRNWVYHEIDFPENNTRKLKSIARSSKLAGCIECPVRYFNLSDKSLVGAPSMVESINYHIHSVDLRTLDPLTARPSTFDSIDPSLPTLILSECCLCYLTPAAADTVALYFTKHFFPSSTPLGLVLYEPIRPDDAFGKTMVSNLATRGIVLQTLKKYGSLDSESARLKVYGFGESRGADINELWKKGVDEVEKELVARLEMVDEVEEWELLAAHYCVAWGWRYGEQESTFGLWDRWTDIFK